MRSTGSAEEVCRACAVAVGVDGAALTAISDQSDHATLARTGPLSTRVAQLQLTTGQGPCLEAFAAQRPVLGADLSTAESQRRWPGFATAALDIGIRAVFAFPLQADTACLGALQLYRRRPGPLTPEQHADALRFADAGLRALLGADLASRLPDPDHEAEPLGGGQDEVFQATGMIAAQLGTSLDEAFVRLRAHAYAHNRPIDDVARDILDRRLRLHPAPDTC